MTEILVAVAGALLLHVFYRAVESRWPENYYGLSDLTSYRLSLHLTSYASFRFLPVIFVSFAASVFVTSSDLGSGFRAALWVSVIHGSATAGRAGANALRQKGVFARRLMSAAHVGVFALVLTGGVVGGLLGRVEALHGIVPDIETITSDVWTALLAGIFGAYVARLNWRSEIDATELVQSSRRRIDPSLLELAETVALANNSEPDLVKAILFVENLQRPQWIRSIERAVGRLLPIGTYGVMQVSTESPISDEESIKLAVSTQLAGVRVRRDDRGYADIDDVERIAYAYNGNDRFVELVTMVYFELSESTPSSSAVR